MDFRDYFVVLLLSSFIDFNNIDLFTENLENKIDKLLFFLKQKFLIYK